MALVGKENENVYLALAMAELMRDDCEREGNFCRHCLMCHTHECCSCVFSSVCLETSLKD